MKLTIDTENLAFVVDGQPVTQSVGIEALQAKLKVDRDGLAERLGRSRRTIDGWTSGRKMTRDIFLMIKAIL